MMQASRRWRRPAGSRQASQSPRGSAEPPARPLPDTVALLTTWNRPALLRQSHPQIEREVSRIGAPLVISDDQSDDPETLALLNAARGRGADLIRRAYVRERIPAVDAYIHNPPEIALRHLQETPSGREVVAASVPHVSSAEDKARAVRELWDGALGTAHLNMQLNNLFGFRHVLATYPSAERILKVDDDVVLLEGAFERILSTWEQAEADGHDVLAVSGIRTVNEAILARFPCYAITHGICNVAIAYRRADWEQLLACMPESLILRDGFDLAFIWQYAPRRRPGAVAIGVSPSVAYHTGFNGVHVRGADLNRE
jgi:hypothetical protein